MAEEVLTIRVSLEPRVFRDIEIKPSASLYKLAEAIIKAFGFGFDHAFGFYSAMTGNYLRSPRKFELFADMDMAEPTDGALSVEKSSVADAYPAEKTKMLFVFDYGDEWTFTTERIATGVAAAKTRYPRTAKIEGDAPEQYPQWEE